jgi:fumarate hydratase subunit beta
MGDLVDDIVRLDLPLTEAKVRSLSAGDFVTLDGEIVITAGLPTHDRIIECADAGRPLPIDIAGGARFTSAATAATATVPLRCST